jgi:hypothetical protein
VVALAVDQIALRVLAVDRAVVDPVVVLGQEVLAARVTLHLQHLLRVMQVVLAPELLVAKSVLAEEEVLVQ